MKFFDEIDRVTDAYRATLGLSVIKPDDEDDEDDDNDTADYRRQDRQARSHRNIDEELDDPKHELFRNGKYAP